jgi:excisionase family DNA binding protein
MNTQEKLSVGLREAAGMLGLSTRTLQNYVWAKRIPSRKVGRRTLVLVSDLELFLGSDQPSVPRSPKLGARVSS